MYLANIQESLAFEQEILSVFNDYHGITIDTFQMNCNTTKAERQSILNAFGSSSRYDRIKIFANVRILNEAVDIVPCDSVFLTKVGDSTNDITTVQRLGRALRKDPCNPTKTAALFLWCDDYGDTVQSLQLLKQEDVQFHAKMRVLNGSYDNTTKDRASVEDKEKKFTRFVEVKCLTLDEMWEIRRQQWISFFSEKRKTPSQHSKDPEEKRLATWQNNMRCSYKKQKLAQERIDLLERTDGWRWGDTFTFEPNLEQWNFFFSEKRKNPSQHSKDPEEKRLASWQSTVRKNYKKQKLAQERIDLLERTDGWRWDRDNFETNLEQWISFFSEKRKNPLRDSKDPEEKRLAKWQTRVRCSYKKQKLAQERIDLLERTDGWRWEEGDTFEPNLEQWSSFFSEKRKTPSQSATDPEEKRLAKWQNKVRGNYKKQKLAQERIDLIERTDGWRWKK